MRHQYIATAAFGLEAVVKREIENLGLEIIKVEDGKVTFSGHEEALAMANLWLRSADRVHLKMGEFTAETFEELYQQVAGIAWEELVPIDGKIVVDCTSVKSTLHSVPTCQSIGAKAVYARLTDFYGVEKMEQTGPLFPVKLSLLKDRVTVTVDTSGDGLHKRGYRVQDVAAPMKETLAAALVQLSFYKKDRTLVDLCCGSGTIPIEAAMIARNIAPGLNRRFLAESWDLVKPAIWKAARKEAFEAMDTEGELHITAMDIEAKAVEAAKENAAAAGVEEDITFVRQDMAVFCDAAPNSGAAGRPPAGEGDIIGGTHPHREAATLPAGEGDIIGSPHPHREAATLPAGEGGIIISNPPYGERIGEKEQIANIYKNIRKLRESCPTWSLFLITTDKRVEDALGEAATRRRKLYNGRLEACYYQYHGQRPERKR